MQAVKNMLVCCSKHQLLVHPVHPQGIHVRSGSSVHPAQLVTCTHTQLLPVPVCNESAPSHLVWAVVPPTHRHQLLIYQHHILCCTPFPLTDFAPDSLPHLNDLQAWDSLCFGPGLRNDTNLTSTSGSDYGGDVMIMADSMFTAVMGMDQVMTCCWMCCGLVPFLVEFGSAAMDALQPKIFTVPNATIPCKCLKVLHSVCLLLLKQCPRQHGGTFANCTACKQQREQQHNANVAPPTDCEVVTCNVPGNSDIALCCFTLQVAIVTLFQRHIDELEQDFPNNLPLLRGKWLFALAARLEKPLQPDVSAALRSLLRYCAKLRCQLSEASDPLLPQLNVLMTVAGAYFGQDEELCKVVDSHELA